MKISRFFLSFLLLTCHECFAQNTFENVVFEGAGIRGIAYAGVVKVLENEGYLKGIKRVGGTSAGAITALAISLGYSSDELEKLISTTNFNHFNDGQFFFFGGLFRLKKKYGYFKGHRFLEWIEKVQFVKTGIHEITFQQLKDKGYKDLYVTGTSLNNQKLIVFSAQTYPNMKVSEAIRISMSIPLYFEAIPINLDGKIVNISQSSDLMLDGGVLANFPIFIFDSLININGKMTRIPNSKTIGFRVDSDEQIVEDRKNGVLAKYPIRNFSDYLGAFYTILLESLNRLELTKNDWERTISISSKQIGLKLKKLSNHQKNMLIESGSTVLQNYLKYK